MRILIYILITFFFTTNLFSQNQAILEGAFIDRSNDTLILYRSLLDPRYAPQKIQPDQDGKFTYLLEYNEMEEYSLAFYSEVMNGAWRPIEFYPDADTIYFELKMNHDEHLISGSKLTSEKRAYDRSLMEMIKPTIDSLNLDMQRAAEQENKDSISYFQNKTDQLHLEFLLERANLARRKSGLIQYSDMMELMIFGNQLPDEAVLEIKKSILVLQEKYPDHVYTETSKNLINAIEDVKPGGRYVDFSAPDNSGHLVFLSEELKESEYTLLDLWAPWCGPCIKKSREIKQQYSKLRKLGLQVVAVMGGLESDADYTANLKKYPYPWPVLKEINNEFQIWFKYNITGAGGLQILFDREGKIMALNPSLEEIGRIIAE